MSDYSRGCLSSEAAMEKHRARGYDGRVLFIRICLSDVCIISDNHSRKDDRSQEVRGVHAVTSVNRDGEADHGAERMDWNRAIEAFTGCAVYEGLQNESIKAWGSSPVMMVDLCDDEINGRLEWPEVPQETISSWSGASSSTAHARNGRSGTAGLFKRHGAFDFLEMPPLQWQSPENTVRISTSSSMSADDRTDTRFCSIIISRNISDRHPRSIDEASAIGVDGRPSCSAMAEPGASAHHVWFLRPCPASHAGVVPRTSHILGAPAAGASLRIRVRCRASILPSAEVA